MRRQVLNVYWNNIVICVDVCMKEKWEFEEKDLEFLQDIARMETGLVAEKWAKKLGWHPEKAENNTRAWLHRIRIRVTRCQNYLNRIRVLQRTSPRIRKLTTSGLIPERVQDFEEE
jgi:hypothetical protein